MRVRLDKWDRFGTSIFSQMTQRATAAGAVNLAQGFPDFDGPEIVLDAAIHALKHGLNQYAPSAGVPALRELLAKRQQERTGLTFKADSEVTVFSGATEALFCAFQAFFGPGDEIVAFEPYFDCYPAGAYAAGAKLVGVRLFPPDFRFEAKALAAAVTPRTKALLLNAPHNPTGRVFSREELELVREVALANDLLVITDEVYEELVFAPARHVPIATLPGMAERTITISSTAKTFSFTGWKVGFAFAPEPLMKAMRAVHQFTVFCSATPLQVGMVEALKLEASYYDDFRADYRERRDTLVQILGDAGFRCRPPEGTYFVMADFGPHAKGRETDFAFAARVTSEAKVAALPISDFYDDPEAVRREQQYVRFAFCKSTATLKAAAANFQERLPTPT